MANRRIILSSWIIILGVGCLTYSVLLFLQTFGGRPAHHFWITAGAGAVLVIGGSTWSFLSKRK